MDSDLAYNVVYNVSLHGMCYLSIYLKILYLVYNYPCVNFQQNFSYLDVICNSFIYYEQLYAYLL